MKYRIFRRADGKFFVERKGWFRWHYMKAWQNPYHQDYMNLSVIIFDTIEEAETAIAQEIVKRTPDKLIKEIETSI